jgi:hypothetical protein
MAFDNLKNRFIKRTKVVFSDFQEADYEFFGPFAYLKHHLRDFVLFDVQAAENVFALLMDTFKHCFINFTKVVFYVF